MAFTLIVKDLVSLELECRAMWIPCHLITDVTGYFALSQLQNLKQLKVTEIGVPEKFDVRFDDEKTLYNIILGIFNTKICFDCSYQMNAFHE